MTRIPHPSPADSVADRGLPEMHSPAPTARTRKEAA